MSDTKSGTKCIKISVTEEEERLIRQNAKACDKTVSAYVTEMALNMCIVPMGYDFLNDHNKQLLAYRHVVTDIAFTIIKTSQHMPSDLACILHTTKDLFINERTFFHLYAHHIESMQKIVEATVRKTVERHLKKIERNKK